MGRLLHRRFFLHLFLRFFLNGSKLRVHDLRLRILYRQSSPERAQNGGKESTEQGTLFRLEVHNLLRFHHVDLADGHRELSRFHISGRQEAGHSGAFGSKNLRGLHTLGKQALADHAGSFHIIHADSIRFDGAGIDDALAANGLGLDTVGHMQVAVDHQALGNQGLIVDGFSLGNVDGFHIVFSFSFFWAASASHCFFVFSGGQFFLFNANGQHQGEIAAVFCFDHNRRKNSAELYGHFRFVLKLFQGIQHIPQVKPEGQITSARYRDAGAKLPVGRRHGERFTGEAYIGLGGPGCTLFKVVQLVDEIGSPHSNSLLILLRDSRIHIKGVNSVPTDIQAYLAVRKQDIPITDLHRNVTLSKDLQIGKRASIGQKRHRKGQILLGVASHAVSIQRKDPLAIELHAGVEGLRIRPRLHGGIAYTLDARQKLCCIRLEHLIRRNGNKAGVVFIGGGVVFRGTLSAVEPQSPRIFSLLRLLIQFDGQFTVKMGTSLHNILGLKECKRHIVTLDREPGGEPGLQIRCRQGADPIFDADPDLLQNGDGALFQDSADFVHSLRKRFGIHNHAFHAAFLLCFSTTVCIRTVLVEKSICRARFSPCARML
nr:MAG TPA: hypothetical protein [Caudoviricetes sp.]